MSIQRAGPDESDVSISEEQSYAGDLIQQRITITTDITAANLDGSTPQEFIYTQDIPMPSSSLELSRGEVAELVACDFHGGSVGVTQQANNGATPSSIRHEMFTFMNELGANNTVQTNHENTSTDSAGNSSKMSTVEERFQTGAWELFQSYAVVTNSFNDTVNGTGGGGFNGGDHDPRYLDLRGRHGIGPLKRWDDNKGMVVTQALEPSDMSNEVVFVKYGITNYYDIHEVENTDLDLVDVAGKGR